MPLLEIFIHAGCFSERTARALAAEIQKECPAWRVEVVENRERASEQGIVAVPAFVADGKLVAVGVPKREWLVQKLRGRRGPTS